MKRGSSPAERGRWRATRAEGGRAGTSCVPRALSIPCAFFGPHAPSTMLRMVPLPRGAEEEPAVPFLQSRPGLSRPPKSSFEIHHEGTKHTKPLVRVRFSCPSCLRYSKMSVPGTRPGGGLLQMPRASVDPEQRRQLGDARQEVRVRRFLERL